jgi:mono/diheme cytochrome c family protein
MMSMEIGDPPAGEPLVTVSVGDGPDKIVAVVGPDPAPRAVGPWQAAFLVSLPVLLLAYVVLAAYGAYSAFEHKKPAPPVAVLPEGWEPDGAILFAQNCARCHGATGNADGFVSFFLDPPARRFGHEKFALATTTNGAPTDDDLMYVIRHGIPGTSMPAFDNLTDADRLALAGHVRRLAYSGLYTALVERAKKDEDPDDEELRRLRQEAAKRLVPGPPLPIPELPEPSAESLASGGQVFQKNCATCHGPQGKGDGPQVKGMKNDNGWPTKPRDLARGVFKGGSDKDRVYARIALGLPGTPMPGTVATLKPQELIDLTNFVLSLSGRDALAEQGSP